MRVVVRGPFAALLAFAALTALLLLVFLSLALVVAVVAPVVGVAHLLLRLRTARALWQSHGRLPTAQGLQLIGERRARGLAAAEALSGLAGLSLSAAPALLLFDSAWGAIAAVAAAFVVGSAAAATRRRSLADLRTVEVLPPE